MCFHISTKVQTTSQVRSHQVINGSRLGAVLVRLVGHVVATGSWVAVGGALVETTTVGSVAVGVVVVVGVAQRSIGTRHGQLLGVVEVLLAAETARLAAGAAVVGGAAADGEHPEEGGGDGEGGSDPHGGQEPGVDGPGDTVSLGRALDSTNHNGGHGCGQGGGGTDCDGGEHGGDEGAAREGARAVGEDAQEQRDAEGDVGDDEDDLSPLCDGAEGVHSSLHTVREGDILAGGAGHGVELGLEAGGGVGSPVELSLLACPVAGRGDLAVAPEADEVGIGQAKVGSADVSAGSNAGDGRLSIGSGRNASGLGGGGGARDEVGSIARSTAGGSNDRVGEITLVETPVA